MAKHRTKHHKPIVLKPNEQFWAEVRQSRYDIHVSQQNAMYEVLGLMSPRASGGTYTAQPTGHCVGDGCFRSGDNW